MGIKNIYSLFVSVVAVVMLMPTLVLGATVEVGEEVFIEKGSGIQDNLYIAAGNVFVSNAIFGDLFTAGGNVLISENVSEDILAVGGAVTIMGDSGGDTRAVGGNVLITGDVSGELIVVGGSVVISSDVLVRKDIIVAGGQVIVDGDINGDAQIAGGAITINGHIRGDVKVKVGDKLTVGDGAVINGDLEYSAQTAEALKISDSAVITGETVFKEVDAVNMDGAKNFIVAAIGLIVLFKLIAFIVAALILTKLFGGFSNSVVNGVVLKPLHMLGKGFVTLVVVPAASILLFVTLIGIPLGLMVILSYGLLTLITGIYAGVVVGAWVSKVIRKSDHTAITWKNVIGGIVLLTIIGFIPIIGWLVGLLVFLVTLGSLVDIVHRKLWKDR